MNNVRLKRILVVVLLLSLAVALVGCKQDTVKVRTGTKVVCKYGHLIKDNTRVIKVPKSEAKKYGIFTVRKLCKKHRKVEELLSAAKEALAKGDVEEAKDAVKQIIKKEPRLKKEVNKLGKDIKAQVEGIGEALVQQERKASAEITTGFSSATVIAEGSRPNTGSSQFSQVNVATPVDLYGLLPTSIPGYVTGSTKKMSTWVSGTYSPEPGSGAESLVITIYARDSEEKAAEFITNVSKVAFSKDSKDKVEIHGTEGYFGTNGTIYATLAWHDKNIVYELVMRSSGSPAGLFLKLMDVSKYLQ